MATAQAARAQLDRDLRHARSGRRVCDRRSYGGDARRKAPTDRHARRAVSNAEQLSRRRIHRPGDARRCATGWKPRAHYPRRRESGGADRVDAGESRAGGTAHGRHPTRDAGAVSRRRARHLAWPGRRSSLCRVALRVPRGGGVCARHRSVLHIRDHERGWKLCRAR